MKNLALPLMMLGLAALIPMNAQGQNITREATAEADAQAPRSGVRFVVCSATGGRMPSPLYYQVKDGEFKQVSITGRTPSVRIRPNAQGQICFWDTDPTAEQESETAGDKKPRSGRTTARQKVELPPPSIIIDVPTDAKGKQLCILVPRAEDAKKPLSYFISERDLPARGMHVINMSPYNARMSLSNKGDFSDAKRQLLGAMNPKNRGISKQNIWSYAGGSVDGGIAFMLEYQPDVRQPARFMRVKSSRFVYSERQAQITVLVKDPKRKGVKMLTIQMTKD